MIKDADVHPAGRDAAGKVCGKGTELPCPFQKGPSPSTSTCPSAQKLPKLCPVGVFMEILII